MRSFGISGQTRTRREKDGLTSRSKGNLFTECKQRNAFSAKRFRELRIDFACTVGASGVRNFAGWKTVEFGHVELSIGGANVGQSNDPVSEASTVGNSGLASKILGAKWSGILPRVCFGL